MSDETTDAPWIPIEALPVDLQVKCARSTDNRWHAKARVYQMSSWMLNAGIITLLVGAATAILTTRTPAFGSYFFRAGTLVAGLAFVGTWIAVARMRRFLGVNGQRLVIGPTCLVVVDAEAMRILPAGHLTITPNLVQFGGETIDNSTLAPTFRAELEQARAAAADPAARAADRFRAAAARAQPWTDSRVRWRRRAPALVASVAGVLVALILEAGPLHARAMRTLEAEARAHSFGLEVEKKVAYREALAVTLANDVDLEAKRLAREKLLADAAQGREIDLHTFLQRADADNPDRPDIIGRLSDLCDAKFPTTGLLGMARLQRLLARVLCVSAQGDLLEFICDDSKITMEGAQKVARDLADKLQGSGYVKTHYASSPPKGEPYLVLKVTKEGPSLGAVMGVRVVATVHDARGVSSEPYAYSTKVPDPSYVPPRKEPDTKPWMDTDLNNSMNTRYSCPPGTVTCGGLGAGGWCCPSGSSCYGFQQCMRYTYQYR